MPTPPPDPSSTTSDAPVTGLQTHRPKAERFSALAQLWFFPSMGAVLILALNFDAWRKAESFPAAVSATHFEQWIAVVLLTLHPVFFGLERHYRHTERPVPVPPDEDEETREG